MTTERNLLKWLDEFVHRGVGAIQFGLTESGDVGVFVDQYEHAIGTGDTVAEALQDAMRDSWAELSEMEVAA